MATFRGSGSVENGAAFPTEAELELAILEAEASASAAAASNAACEVNVTESETAQTAAELAETNAETAETNSAASAAAALVSEGLADADATATAADLVATNQDTIDTAADLVNTNADVTYSAEWANKAENLLVSAAAGGDQIDDYSSLHWANKANADAVATAADLVATNQDTIDTAADLALTNADVVSTNADVVITNADVVLTHADVVLTNADVATTTQDAIDTAADAATTTQDAIDTAADAVATAADAVSTAADAASAAASFDSFDDIYLGPKASPPTLDNDGNALVDGQLYWHTGDNTMYVRDTAAWLQWGGDYILKTGGTYTGNMVHKTSTFTAEFDEGNSGTAQTLDWTESNKIKSTLTGNVTFTFTAPAGPTNIVLKLVQDATGSRTVTWPATVKWAGGAAAGLSTGANDIDILSFYFDGTDYYGAYGLNYS